MKVIGIYRIQSQVKPERYYIGSAMNMNSRWKQHLRSLKNGKHHSFKLQNHYNKYGECDLVFIIIEPCLPVFLTVREDFYLKPLPYFNICHKAGSCLGVKHSEETKQKNRQYHLGKRYSEEINKKKGSPGKNNPMFGVSLSGEKNGMFGKVHSEETRKKMSLARKGKDTNTPEKIEKARIRMRGNKYGELLKGVPKSEEFKEKMRGKRHSEESIIKMRNSKLGKKRGKYKTRKLIA